MGFGPATIARQSQKSIASRARTWSARNVTIGQAGVRKPVTDSFVTTAQAMRVAIDLAYLTMVILFRSLLVPLVIFFAPPLVIIGPFVVLAMTGPARDLSALLIGLLMP